MAANDLPRTIADAAAWLRQRRITAVELTEALLQRAHAAQPRLEAFITFMDDSALRAAREADRLFGQSVDRGPLQGIPLAVKDILSTEDAPTTANSRVMDPEWGKQGDATVVRKLRQAGAVITGKLALHEYACGFPDPAAGFPIPKNPWDVSRTPGGSSSGTGAAIAARLVLGGLGTDTGGSVRGPASFCGISGLKPSFGLVSKAGCVPLGYSLDNIGPMAWTALDCALMLQGMAGFDPADACSVDVPLPNVGAALDGSLSGVRIGVPREYFFTDPGLNAEVKEAVLAAVAAMEGAGARVRDVSIPHAHLGRDAAFITSRSESYAYHEPDLQQRPHLYGKYARQTLQMGALFNAGDYVQAQRARSLLKAECDRAIAEVDVLITPTMPGTASQIEGYDPDERFTGPNFMALWNLTGLPALSVPCGFSRAGLPIGMQIIGRPFADAVALKIGDAYQRITSWHTKRPELPSEVRVG